MGLVFFYGPGQTPLSEEEKEGLLLKNISTRRELDEFEQMNIEKAIEWTLLHSFRQKQILTETFVQELHHRMFKNVWSSAGDFRRSNKNLGVEWPQIGIHLKALLDDCSFWIENGTFGPEEIAIRLSHRIVAIHCFSNGNGRHSRLMADILMGHVFGKPVFNWGRNSPGKKGEARADYLSAIKEADKGNVNPLLFFALS
jgi:Fic-DOC domain mobile mystery protein B